MIVYDKQGRLLHVNDSVIYGGTTWTIKKIKGQQLILERLHLTKIVDTDKVVKAI
jgi:hypothetical protein